MISDKNKRKIKEIKLLKENNWQKKYQTFTTYFKEFRRPYSNQNPIKKKISYNPKNDNFFYFRLRNKNSFIHKPAINDKKYKNISPKYNKYINKKTIIEINILIRLIPM